MQLGVAPFLIGNIDTRPFKPFLDWDRVSLYARSVDEALGVLDSYTTEELLQFGERAKRVWKERLTFGRWCKYVFKELESIS
jgi:hypothetical protein